MYEYTKELAEIRQMIGGFLKNKVIDVKQLAKMDIIIKKSEEDQFKVLNSSIPLEIQRAIFGAIRNINITMKAMKTQLHTAAARHENPTTAEKAMEIFDSIQNLNSSINAYMGGNRRATISELERYSRMVYRKGRALGFSEDEEQQLKEAGITESQVESFIDRFDTNLAKELDISEEVQSASENSH